VAAIRFPRLVVTTADRPAGGGVVTARSCLKQRQDARAAPVGRPYSFAGGGAGGPPTATFSTGDIAS
jgi:hypothetical protein